MKNKIIDFAIENGADIVGFASSDRFEKDDPIFKIFPQTKTVIGLAFRVLRGCYRGVEEGSTYFQYTTMGVENMEETVMPMTQMRVAMLLEEMGFIAVPQRRQQNIMAETDSTNPEIIYKDIYRGKVQETQIDFLQTALKCGLGEKGLHNVLLTDEYGPMIRYCFILTDAEIQQSEIPKKHLCDNCGKCIKACHGMAIDETGNVDPWQCAVYYKGANGTKNPFMPKDAFAEFDERMEIIAGKLKLDTELAKKIIETYFYPPFSHSYEASICGRACDVACYMHLEEKGLLKKKFKTPFRKRNEWKFELSDYKKEQ